MVGLRLRLSGQPESRQQQVALRLFSRSFQGSRGHFNKWPHAVGIFRAIFRPDVWVPTQTSPEDVWHLTYGNLVPVAGVGSGRTSTDSWAYPQFVPRITQSKTCVHFSRESFTVGLGLYCGR